MNLPFVRCLSVLGPGLLGGSILLAGRARLPKETRLIAWSRDGAEREAVRARGLADVVTADLGDAVRGADLVVLCTPPAAMAGLAREFAPHLKPDAVVTDVASVKAPVVAALGSLLGHHRFLGAHPMAGREHGGLAAAQGDLFGGTVCLLTPSEGDRSPATGAAGEVFTRVERFWRELGCRAVRALSPAEHDRVVAAVSHGPHLLAGALLTVTDPAARDCAGPGFRDLTRLAAGPPELWTEILSLNRPAVRTALLALAGELRRLADGPLSGPGREAELAAYLRAAGELRRGLENRPDEA